jgi:hypothetical protein
MEDIENINFILNKYNTSDEEVLLISQIMRIKFFNALRDLIREKDMENDQIALDVLDWAYQRLANVDELL